jgi:hypothetical protein
MEITDKSVEEGLNAVAQMVFPFRLLENQKQWMRRRMRKPKELSIRKFVAAAGRLNNSLPVFPNSKESDKFTLGEILEILEWSIPKSWRTKFDLDGYVPTEFTKERFMTECEAIERNEPKIHQKTNNSTVSGKTVTHKKSHGVKFRSATQKSNTTAKFYCTEHGQNPSHPTDKCYTLKNHAEKARGASSSGLTKKSFCKEINILAKGRPRKKVLEMFNVVLQQEHNKLAAKTPKKAKKIEIIIDESSDSENESMSLDQMSISKTDKTKSPTYQSRIENLGAITNDE